jgi:hypothetical protein
MAKKYVKRNEFGERYLEEGGSVQTSDAKTQCLAFLPDSLLQSCPGFLEVFRDEFGVGEHRHEVRVAVPSGDNVKMNVLVDAGSRNASHICSEVETMRSADLDEGTHANRSCMHNFHVYIVRKRFEFGRVLVRHNHQMTAVVREQIHHEEAMLPAPNSEVLFVTTLFRYPTEETRLAF